MKWDAVSTFRLAVCAALELGLRPWSDALGVCKFSEMVLSSAFRNGSPVMFLVLSSSILRRTYRDERDVEYNDGLVLEQREHGL